MFFYVIFNSCIISIYLLCSGTRIKTRKRNIPAPLDPAAFADAVVQIYLDNVGDLVNIIMQNLNIFFLGLNLSMILDF